MLNDFIIERIKAEFPFVPNEEKSKLLRVLSDFILDRTDRQAFLLRGYAGTGKTSVVSAVVKALGKLNKQCVLLAPTGRAAKVLSKYAQFPAYTIHKYIYRQKQLGEESFSIDYNKHKHTLFIVDEASMLSGYRDNGTFGSGCLLDDLISYIYSGDGCSLLLLGDDAQLSPVGSEESPALSSDFITHYGLYVRDFILTDVARQALDSGILSNATRIRELLTNERNGIQTAHPDKHFVLFPNKDVTHLEPDQVVETYENSCSTVGLEDVLIITRSNKLTNLYNQAIRARVLWKEDLLSNGDRVMVSKNNYFWTKEYDGIDFIANGDSFEVVRLYGHHELYGFQFANATLRAMDYDWEIDAFVWLDTLTTDSPEHNYSLQKELFSRIAEDYPEIQNKKELTKKIFESPYYNALQIRFAYAVTCHKSQGGQWKHIYIDTSGIAQDTERLSNDTERHEFLRWLYTATTRATEHIYILR